MLDPRHGATNHMTSVRSAFFELDTGVHGTVRFGDGSVVDIEGRGTILFGSMPCSRCGGSHRSRVRLSRCVVAEALCSTRSVVGWRGLVGRSGVHGAGSGVATSCSSSCIYIKQ